MYQRVAIKLDSKNRLFTLRSIGGVRHLYNLAIDNMFFNGKESTLEDFRNEMENNPKEFAFCLKNAIEKNAFAYYREDIARTDSFKGFDVSKLKKIKLNKYDLSELSFKSKSYYINYSKKDSCLKIKEKNGIEYLELPIDYMRNRRYQFKMGELNNPSVKIDRLVLVYDVKTKEFFVDIKFKE